MAEIAPAVLAENPQDYAHDLAIATSLSSRIQIDLVDGEFAQHRTINLIQAYWPEAVRADLHLMYNDPFAHIETIISLTPHLVIVHAEAREMSEAHMHNLKSELEPLGIKLGIALLKPSAVPLIDPFISYIDHVLVFTGELGHYGGELDEGSLDKIAAVKSIDADIEVGVDGGINDQTIQKVIRAGADVCNVGSFLQKAEDPQTAYDKLTQEMKT